MSKFKEIGVAKNLCKSINEMGFINATEVQKQSIPFLLLENRDLISLAHDGFINLSGAKIATICGCDGYSFPKSNS